MGKKWAVVIHSFLSVLFLYRECSAATWSSSIWWMGARFIDRGSLRLWQSKIDFKYVFFYKRASSVCSFANMTACRKPERRSREASRARQHRHGGHKREDKVDLENQLLSSSSSRSPRRHKHRSHEQKRGKEATSRSQRSPERKAVAQAS